MREKLPLLAGVVTLPAGLLALLFGGLEPAAAVFVVGWFLLTPVALILFEDESDGESASDSSADIEGSEADPIEQLRERYASGEIDEREFKRRLDGLLGTEGVDPTDEREIERAVEMVQARPDAERERE